MKKILIVLLLLVAIIAPALAGNANYIGASVGADIAFRNSGSDDEYSAFAVGLPIKIEGATFFGDSKIIGFGYAAGASIPLYFSEEDPNSKVAWSKDDEDISILADVEIIYRIEFSDIFSLYVGGGVGVDYIFGSNSRFDLSIFLDIKGGVDLASNFKLLAGFTMGNWLYSTSSVNGTNSEAENSVDIVPYIGVAYSY